LSALKLFARLPFAVLYPLAAGVAWLAFHVFKHRRHVIRPQLEKVFPAASESERDAIHRQFLGNYCQVMVEILKTAALSPADMRERVRCVDFAPARGILDAGRSVLLLTSHMGNWEWLLQGVTLELGHPVDAAYKPIRDPRGDRLLLELRSRFGARLVPAKDLLPDLLKRRGVVHALAVNADQAPAPDERHLWTRFLGVETAFYVGAEQIARAVRLPIFYVALRRVRRGFYEAHLTPLWDGREPTQPGEITQRYARLCESEVLRSPADWLWTYRRWRFAKPLYGES
jgi:KDO2-lipid IV(A) lauroyltransferase